MKLAGTTYSLEIRDSYGKNTFYLVNAEDPLQCGFFTFDEFELLYNFVVFHQLDTDTFGIRSRLQRHPALAGVKNTKYLHYSRWHIIMGGYRHGSSDVCVIFDLDMNVVGQWRMGKWVNPSAELAGALLQMDWWIGMD